MTLQGLLARTLQCNSAVWISLLLALEAPFGGKQSDNNKKPNTYAKKMMLVTAEGRAKDTAAGRGGFQTPNQTGGV